MMKTSKSNKRSEIRVNLTMKNNTMHQKDYQCAIRAIHHKPKSLKNYSTKYFNVYIIP